MRRMKAALVEAASAFHRYAELHRAKGTPEAEEKALANGELYLQMTGALTAPTFTTEELQQDDVLQYFSYAHLTNEEMREASEPFARMARDIIDHIPRCPQRTMALNKLVEAKDCAVRAAMWKPR